MPLPHTLSICRKCVRSGAAAVAGALGRCVARGRVPYASGRLRAQPRSPRGERMMQAEATIQPVVSVEDLHVSFVMRDATVAAVNGVSFELGAGQVLGILGESGSGKSVTL